MGSILTVLAWIVVVLVVWPFSGWVFCQLYGVVFIGRLVRRLVNDGRNSILMDMQRGFSEPFHSLALVKMRKVMPGWLYRWGNFRYESESWITTYAKTYVYWICWPLWGLDHQEAAVLNGRVITWERVGSPRCKQTRVPLLPLLPGETPTGSPAGDFELATGMSSDDELFQRYEFEDCGMVEPWICVVSGEADCDDCSRTDCEGPWDLPLAKKLEGHDLKPGMITVVGDESVTQVTPEQFAETLPGFDLSGAIGRLAEAEEKDERDD